MSHRDQRLSRPSAAIAVGVATLVLVAAYVVPRVGLFSPRAAEAYAQVGAPTSLVPGDASQCVSRAFQAKATAAFDAKAPGLAEAVRTQLSATSSQVLYDTQLLLAPLLEMAINCNDRALQSRIAGVLLPAAAKLTIAVDPTSGTIQRQWQVNGREIRLNSAQFLHLVARLLTGIAAIVPAERTATQQQFAAAFPSVLAEHVKFWVFQAPYFNPSGCAPDSASVGHGDYLRTMRASGLGTGRSYCNSPADRDLLMTADAAELLRAATIDPTMVPLDALGVDRSALVAYLNDATRTYRALFVPTLLTDETGGTRAGLDFDTGGWRDWTEDHGYSADTSTTFPTPADVGTDQRASWDLSHARRLISLFASARGVSSLLDAPFPSDNEMRAFADQVAYAVATDVVKPRFRNYLSGVNGWFRVNYNGRPGFGYGPFDSGTQAFLEGGFGSWGAWSTRLITVTGGVERVLTATDPATVAMRTESYAVVWNGGVRTSQFDPARVAMTFYPSALVPAAPANSTTDAQRAASTNKAVTTTKPATTPTAKPASAAAAPAPAATNARSLAKSVRWSPSYDSKSPSAVLAGAKLPGAFASFLAPEPNGASRVEWYLDGKAVHLDDATPPYDLQNALVEAGCGRHEVTVTVVAAGRRNVSARVPFTITTACRRS